MQTLPIGRYHFFQRLQPTSILNQVINKKTSGCLQVFSTSATWLIYLREGKVMYVCYGEGMLEMILGKLQALNSQIPPLTPEVYQQLKTVFSASITTKDVPNIDYLAICWLVNQKYLTSQQAELLIEELALELIQSLLKLQEGSYEIINNVALEDMPKFCQLDLRMLMENRRSTTSNPAYQSTAKSATYTYRSATQTSSHTPRNPSQNQTQTNNENYEARGDGSGDNFNKQRVYTILCIDDSPTVLGIIQNFLDEQFFQVFGISEPIKALMQIIRLKPDLILLDVGMPNLDGYELCGLIRKHAYFKKTPIIMVTGRTGLIDRARAKMMGASGYLTKPFTQADLLKIVFHHLS